MQSQENKMAPPHLFFHALLASVAIASALPLVDVFTAYSGEVGYPTCYRQPILVVIDAHNLLAFAEGRVNGYCSGAADGTNSSIWLRRSADGGATWAPAQMLFDAPPQVRLEQLTPPNDSLSLTLLPPARLPLRNL